MSLFGLELFSPPRIICLYHKVSPPCCSNSTDKREERLGLKSHGSGLRRVCAQQQEPGAGAARGRRGVCGTGGHRGCRPQGQRRSRSEAPEEPRGERAGEEGPQEPGRGAVRLDFFWQRAAGKLAGAVPGSSELRLGPPFHEH